MRSPMTWWEHQQTVRGNRCIRCGSYLSEGREICPHHLAGQGLEWHLVNKIMCDYFHRGVTPPRVKENQKDWYQNFIFGDNLF